MFLILCPIYYYIINSLSVDLYPIHICVPRQSVPVQTMLCQLWRCWPSIETTMGEFPVSARVLGLMPATAPMFPAPGHFAP